MQAGDAQDEWQDTVKLADTTKENRAAEESRAAEKSWYTEEEVRADPKLQLDQKRSKEGYCQQPEHWAGTPRPTSQKQSREEYCQQPEHWAGTPETRQAGIADCNQEKDVSDQSVRRNLRKSSGYRPKRHGQSTINPRNRP